MDTMEIIRPLCARAGRTNAMLYQAAPIPLSRFNGCASIESVPNPLRFRYKLLTAELVARSTLLCLWSLTLKQSSISG